MRLTKASRQVYDFGHFAATRPWGLTGVPAGARDSGVTSLVRPFRRNSSPFHSLFAIIGPCGVPGPPPASTFRPPSPIPPRRRAPQSTCHRPARACARRPNSGRSRQRSSSTAVVGAAASRACSSSSFRTPMPGRSTSASRPGSGQEVLRGRRMVQHENDGLGQQVPPAHADTTAAAGAGVPGGSGAVFGAPGAGQQQLLEFRGRHADIRRQLVGQQLAVDPLGHLGKQRLRQCLQARAPVDVQAGPPAPSGVRPGIGTAAAPPSAAPRSPRRRLPPPACPGRGPRAGT